MYTMDQEIMMQKKKDSFTRALGVQRDSQTISKIKPKIRIIHIFAPDVIKTDASNFRQLVQQLTGKPADSTNKKLSRKNNNTPGTTTTVVAAAAEAKTDKMEVVVRSSGGSDRYNQCYERMKGEEEIWSGVNSGGGYLSGFVDQPEGFMEQLNYEFPLLPVGSGAHGCLW